MLNFLGSTFTFDKICYNLSCEYLLATANGICIVNLSFNTLYPNAGGNKISKLNFNWSRIGPGNEMDYLKVNIKSFEWRIMAEKLFLI